MNELLNSQLVYKLREVINKTDIFIKDPIEKRKFNLICAIMDRFDSSVIFINNNQNLPKSEADFINLLVHISIIKDGVNIVLKVLGESAKTDNKIFEKYYLRDLPNINKTIDDDKFYEYFRSLAFAHPFITDRSIPNAIDKEEIQYSPYLLIGINHHMKDDDNIGVEVYSNKRSPFSITFNFESLKEYVKWKFEMILDITLEFEKIIKSKERKWKEHKVNRNLDSIGILNDVKSILTERYMETYIIEDLISYLMCKNTLEINKDAVEKYKNAIVKTIPDICDGMDEYDHEKIYDVVEDILHARPKAHPMMNYQLEKIFCYLNDDYGDIEWGLIQAEEFANGFAKKWVTIEPYNMSFDEIKMLTNAACYLEYKEQKEQNI